MYASVGKVGVSFASYTTKEDLARLSHTIVSDAPADFAALDQIVLIIPDTVRQQLGWPPDRHPQVVLYLNELVFLSPDETRHLSKQ